jgi:hypothetical protein
MALPPDIMVRQEPGLTRFILPRRHSGPKAAGCVPIVFGMIFAGFAIVFMLSAVGLDFWNPEPPPPAPVPAEVAPEQGAPDDDFFVVQPKAFHWTDLFAACFALPFLAAGLFVMGIGILSFFPSHSEIHFTATELVCIEETGPLRIRRRRLLKNITAVRLDRSFEKSASPANFGITLQTAAPEKDVRAAHRYPLPLVTLLAGAVAEELRRAGNSQVTLDTTPPAADPAAASAQESPAPALPQPPESKITCIPAPDSMTFMIPRTGFSGGSAKFFLIFSLIWNGISFPMFLGILLSLIHEPSWENLGVLGFISIFVAIGTAFALAGIQTAFRKSVLLATRESLVFTQTGPIRKMELQWNPADIAAILSQNSNTTVNGKRLKQLAVTTKGMSPRIDTMLTGRDDTELEWLASALHDFYKLPRASAEGN